MKNTSGSRGVFCLRGLLLGEAFRVALGHAAKAALFALHDALVHEEVPDGVRALGALADPVGDAFLFDVQLGGVRERLVLAEDLEGFAPRVAGLFRNDEAIEGLLLLADARQTNGEHVFVKIKISSLVGSRTRRNLP